MKKPFQCLRKSLEKVFSCLSEDMNFLPECPKFMLLRFGKPLCLLSFLMFLFILRNKMPNFAQS